MKVDYSNRDGFPAKMGFYLTKDGKGIERILFYDGMGFALATEPNHYIKIGGDIWKILIRWGWLVGVVVPYNTDGKIRCEKCELVEIVDRKGKLKSK